MVELAAVQDKLADSICSCLEEGLFRHVDAAVLEDDFGRVGPVP